MLPLDTKIDIVTPENIAFTYASAGPFRRINAYLVDLVLRTVLLMGLSFLLIPVLATARASGLGVLLLALSWFVLEWFYGGLFETYMNGQTPGKRMMGLRVLTVDGQPINGMQAVLRNVLRAADALPWIPFEVWGGPAGMAVPTYLAGLLAMMCGRRFQRLGDVVCGTMVVVEQRGWYAGIVPVGDQRALQLAAALPAHLTISRSLARALAVYVERRRFFSPARRLELASHIGAALVDRLQLPADTDYDLLLCALYHRAFVSESAGPMSETSDEQNAEWVTPAPAGPHDVHVAAPVE